jgi:hypothetical protein
MLNPWLFFAIGLLGGFIGSRVAGVGERRKAYTVSHRERQDMGEKIKTA